MKQYFLNFIFVVIVNILLSSCGTQLDGTYTAVVEGKAVTIHFEQNGVSTLQGYFPTVLSGNWVEEKTFKESQIWATFDGPEEKPFRIRFELKPNAKNFQLVGIKARPIGKGMKLNPVKFKGSPIFKPR